MEQVEQGKREFVLSLTPPIITLSHIFWGERFRSLGIDDSIVEVRKGGTDSPAGMYTIEDVQKRILKEYPYMKD